MVTLRTVVVGAGIMGVTAARTLRARGHAVTLCDTGPIPHALAASTDISKIVRIEYGADAAYTALGERSLDGWRRWNAELGEDLFHETGVLFVSRAPMAPGGFEHDSHETILARGHAPERLDGEALAARFPAWKTGRYVDGFFHAKGGFVESGRVVERLVSKARDEGVVVREGASFDTLVDASPGVVLRGREVLTADRVVMAVGAWTPHVFPELMGTLRATGHPVFHLRPRDPERFVAARFPVFGAAIAETGWYGFPLHPRSGVVKVARHSVGRPVHPTAAARDVIDEERGALREFLTETFPELLDAEVVATRVCLYCDSADGHFWIDRDPARPWLTVAAGDSGHGFKFAPVLGDLIADAVEGQPADPRFRWRAGQRPQRHEEAARHR